MNTLFAELLQYSHHSNIRLIEAFAENPAAASEKSVKLLSHVMNAHRIWNSRVLPQQLVFGIWHIHPIENLKEIEDANHQHSLHILQQFDANQPISYTNLKGDAYTNTLADIFFHIINHGTYHRAQIATDFKQNSTVPLITDYIHYKWQMP